MGTDSGKQKKKSARQKIDFKLKKESRQTSAHRKTVIEKKLFQTNQSNLKGHINNPLEE